VGFLWFGRRPDAAPSEDQLARLLARWVAPWRHLRTDERARLVEHTDTLIRVLRWEGSRGFTVTDDMRVAVAGNAALLVNAFDDGLASYRDITSVIVHPTTIVHTGTRYIGSGMFSDEADPIIGEAIHRGPVLVAWDAAAQQCREPWRGENVVLHEFAHRLDMLDGLSDGTPPLPDPETMAEWVRVCTRTLQAVRANQQPSVLRYYAATNPAEFFAVATEVFFTLPATLREENGALYDLLRGYYRHDPAVRWPEQRLA
jgi:Mlc titration factor MtfA (ptsG expression regulator)